MPLKKNTSLNDKNTEILIAYRAHFGSFMNLARIRLVCHIITALCKVRSVNYSKLSSGFATGATGDSNYRRIRRFMASAKMPMEWVSKMIFTLIPFKGPYVLVMDRTNWKLGESNINILMLGITYKNIAFPLLFRMLDKRGNSNTEERIALVNNFIAWFGLEHVDRLEKLVLLVMIAIVWCSLIGDCIDRKKRPIQIKKHGRRAVSVSKYGLDYLSRVLLIKCNKFNINVLQFLSCTLIYFIKINYK